MKNSMVQRNSRQMLLLAISGYIGALGLYSLARSVHNNTEVIATALHPFAQGFGHQLVTMYGKFTVILPFEPFTMRDFLTAASLLLAGACSGLTFLLLGRAGPGDVPERRPFLLSCLGFSFLGLDELFMFHEFAGLNLARLLHPGVTAAGLIPYDFNGHIIVLYAIAGIAVLIAYRKIFLKSRIGALLLGAGLALQAIAAGIDFLWSRLETLAPLLGPLRLIVYRDELLEMTAAYLYLVAFVVYGLTTVGSYFALEPRSTPAREAKIAGAPSAHEVAASSRHPDAYT